MNGKGGSSGLSAQLRCTGAWISREEKVRQPMGPGILLGGCRSHQAPGCGKGMVTHESSRSEAPKQRHPACGMVTQVLRAHPHSPVTAS